MKPYEELRTGEATPPASSPSPQDTIRSLNTVIKALVLMHGEPQATQPLTTTFAIGSVQLERAANTRMTIRQERNDIDPAPYLLITVEGA